MAAKPRIYTRLTRNAAGVGTYTSLWLASDHLLVVSSTGYNETYTRIMFSDIKAFFVTPTGRRLWWGLPWGVIGAISWARAILSLVQGDQPIASAVLVALSTAALIANWMFGGGCRVQVMTGVQNTVLPSLIRMPKTRAVLARLQPLIVAAQAERVRPPVEPGSTTTGADPAGASPPAVPAATPPPDAPVPS